MMMERAGRGFEAVDRTSTTAVITPRATRLVRVPDLRAMQRAVVEIVKLVQLAHVDHPGTLPRTAIVLPTRSAAAELQRHDRRTPWLLQGRDLEPCRRSTHPWRASTHDLVSGCRTHRRGSDRASSAKCCSGSPPAPRKRAGTTAPFRCGPGSSSRSLGLLRRTAAQPPRRGRLPSTDQRRARAPSRRSIGARSVCCGRRNSWPWRSPSSSGGPRSPAASTSTVCASLLLEKPVVPAYEHVIVDRCGSGG